MKTRKTPLLLAMILSAVMIFAMMPLMVSAEDGQDAVAKQTVSFDTLGLAADIDDVTVNAGEKVASPDDPVPTADGFTFGGWYTDENYTTAWDFATDTVTDDITLHAKWTHEHDGITFVSWGNAENLPSAAGNYVLTKDVTLGTTWSTGKDNDFNFCLNGHNIHYQYNTGLIESQGISVENGASVSIYDCAETAGTISTVKNAGVFYTIFVWPGGELNLYNGKFSNSQTGVRVSENSEGLGVFNMYGGEISGNSAKGVDCLGEFHMYGGDITNNTKGVYLQGTSNVYISAGNITGNSGRGVDCMSGILHLAAAKGSDTSGTINITGNGRNVFLDNIASTYEGFLNYKRINVDAKLSSDTKIGIWSDKRPSNQDKNYWEVILTKGCKDKGTLDNFTSDRPYNTETGSSNYPYKMTMNDDGELVLRTVLLVEFDANGGSGTMETVEVLEGDYELPECGFTAPEDKIFDRWESRRSANGPAGTIVKIDINYTEDWAIKAIWRDKKEFNVTFTDGQGNTLKTETVKECDAATAPEEPTRNGFDFDGWDADFSNVTEDLTVNAKWTKHVHTWDNGKVTKKATLTTTGTMLYTCTKCGATKTETIAKVKLGTTKVSAIARSPKKMAVSWNKVSGASSYIVAYRIAGQKWTTKAATGTSVVLSGMKTGKLYQYKVAAVKNATAKTAKVTGSYSAPAYRFYRSMKSLKAAGKKKSIKLTWKKTTGATGYVIQYSLTKNFSGCKQITINKANAKAYTIKNLKKGKTYYVRMRPVKKSGGKSYLGILSSIKKVKVK